MGWSTSVVSPPDGDMTDYLASLDKVRARDFSTLWPAHGPPIRAPRPFLDAYIAHRLAREAQILSRLAVGDAHIKQMVAAIYASVDKRLHPAACHSVLAHLTRLAKLGAVTCEAAPEIDALYRLARGA